MQFLGVPGIQFVVQSVFHAWIVTLAVEGLLKIWEVRYPVLRARFRLLVLALPLVAWPAFQLLWPERGGEAFRAGPALIDLNAWLSLMPLGIPLFYPIAALLVANAAVFFTQELLPALKQQLFSVPLACDAVPARVERAFARVCQRAGITPGVVSICVTAQEDPVAYTAGLRNQRMVISTGLVDTLDDEEMETVLAHELAHRLRYDNRTGWAILGLGTLMLYNPLALLELRLIAQERERACDDVAAQTTGKPLALASALLKVARRTMGGTLGYHPRARLSPVAWLQMFGSRAVRAQIEERVTRLVKPVQPRPVPWANLRLAVTAALLAILLYYVV
ncbi:MAG: M56 family metallopeptidase [Chloroflexota bacterium]|nr:M56 family metallopeptidase [Chloroflexota bacterium]